MPKKDKFRFLVAAATLGTIAFASWQPASGSHPAIAADKTSPYSPGQSLPVVSRQPSGNTTGSVIIAQAGKQEPDTKELKLRLLSITSPVKTGCDATVAVQTEPGAKCKITLTLKSGPSTASALKPQKSDEKGQVVWTWKVAKNTAAGDWPVEIDSCLKGRKNTIKTTLKIQK